MQQGWQKEVMRAARSHVGRVEGPGNDNPFGRAYGMIGGVGAQAWNKQSWCAMFACFAYWQAGEPLPAMQAPGFFGFAGCAIGLEWFYQHGMCLDEQDPEAADFIFFLDDHGHATHVGLCDSYRGGVLYTVEGNKGDMVSYCRYTPIDGWRKVRDEAGKVRRIARARWQPCWLTNSCTVREGT